MSFSILISEDDPDFQFLFKVAISEIDRDIKTNIVYTGQELLQCLLKSELNENLQEHNLPNLIIADLKTPFFEWGDIKEIRIYKQFTKIPIYLFAQDFSEILKENASGFGNIDVFNKPYTFQDLKTILNKIIRLNTKSKVDRNLFCSRCEDFIEYYPEKSPFATQIRLKEEEDNFIKSKFKDPLCVPCINQLRTSYKIINGDYNVGSKVIS
jgi:CheY-like chemotaxis protein